VTGSRRIQSASLASIGDALGADTSVILADDNPPAVAKYSEIAITMAEPPAKADQNADFEFARANLLVVISTGHQLLRKVSQVAQEAESAKFFEVAAGMLGTQIVAAKSLLALHEQHRKLAAPPGTDATPETTINNTFVGSTSELQAILRRGTT
jgi:hypothetical protein